MEEIDQLKKQIEAEFPFVDFQAQPEKGGALSSEVVDLMKEQGISRFDLSVGESNTKLKVLSTRNQARVFLAEVQPDMSSFGNEVASASQDSGPSLEQLFERAESIGSSKNSTPKPPPKLMPKPQQNKKPTLLEFNDTPQVIGANRPLLKHDASENAAALLVKEVGDFVNRNNIDITELKDGVTMPQGIRNLMVEHDFHHVRLQVAESQSFDVLHESNGEVRLYGDPEQFTVDRQVPKSQERPVAPTQQTQERPVAPTQKTQAANPAEADTEVLPETDDRSIGAIANAASKASHRDSVVAHAANGFVSGYESVPNQPQPTARQAPTLSQNKPEGSLRQSSAPRQPSGNYRGGAQPAPSQPASPPETVDQLEAKALSSYPSIDTLSQTLDQIERDRSSAIVAETQRFDTNIASINQKFDSQRQSIEKTLETYGQSLSNQMAELQEQMQKLQVQMQAVEALKSKLNPPPAVEAIAKPISEPTPAPEPAKTAVTQEMPTTAPEPKPESITQSITELSKAKQPSLRARIKTAVKNFGRVVTGKSQFNHQNFDGPTLRDRIANSQKQQPMAQPVQQPAQRRQLEL